VKYLPLVLAGLWRKPARAVLTFLAVMIAFTLFGLTIGMNATFDAVEKNARDDRIFTGARFGGVPLPIALEQQIAGMPGVAGVAATQVIPGYHQDPKNRVFVLMFDDNVHKVMTDYPLTPQQWDQIRNNRDGLVISRMSAQRWNLKPGDTFVIDAPQTVRADGAKSWTFRVMSVGDDIPYFSNGYMFGNYDYFDQARALSDRGKVVQLYVLSSDPTHTADIAQKIDAAYANSGTPLQSITEKMALDISNSGVDIVTVDRDIALAGMFMVLFLVANGIAQSVRERFAEFATLRTLGFTDRGVIALVFAEAAAPCLLGALMGVGLAALVSSNISHLVPASIGTPPVPTIDAMVLLWAALSAAAVALASSALPALRLSKMDIATALSERV
jgi:putative ABC transport system permease protein